MIQPPTSCPASIPAFEAPRDSDPTPCSAITAAAHSTRLCKVMAMATVTTMTMTVTMMMVTVVMTMLLLLLLLLLVMIDDNHWG